MLHTPVMVNEVLQFLDPKPDQNFIDCTLGDGGHALAVLERISPNGRLLGIDADPQVVAEIRNPKSEIRELFVDRLIAVNANFRNLAAIVKSRQFGPVHGVFLDLGFSSSTLERGRGFSFMKDEVLDMRFNPQEGIRAAEIVNGWNQQQLAELLTEYGEEKLAREIANKIVAGRKVKPITMTKQLVEIILMAYREKLTRKRHPERSEGSRSLRHGIPRRLAAPRNDTWGGRIPWIGGIHPATKTFQALRIAVNDELNALQETLPQALEVLQNGGRLAVLCFHSLEDRIVKQFFKDWTDTKIKLLTKKPLVPTEEEIRKNPQARSAKLRVAEKLAN